MSLNSGCIDGRYGRICWFADVGCHGKRRLEWPFTKIGKTGGGSDWQRGDISIRRSDGDTK